jgi:ribonuclease P protein component
VPVWPPRTGDWSSIAVAPEAASAWQPEVKPASRRGKLVPQDVRDDPASVRSKFGKSRRLLDAASYRHVFEGATHRLGNDYLLLLARSNRLGHARLGLVVAKKTIKLSVRRNRIKRVVRETFRLKQHRFDSVDVVFLARRGLQELPDDQQAGVLEKSWNQLERKLRQNKGGKR